MLLPSQTAFDRPDITVRVFHARLESLIKNIRIKKYFGPDNEVTYLIRVIEYQVF